jgi:NAD-dependent SIR2 family protein deacetylase
VADTLDEEVDGLLRGPLPHVELEREPDVVFFGENFPGERYAHACQALAGADAMLVAGSSLMVYSGFRFVRLAHEAGLPIAIVKRGRTHGDDLAELKIEGDVGSTLIEAAGALREPSRPMQELAGTPRSGAEPVLN